MEKKATDIWGSINDRLGSLSYNKNPLAYADIVLDASTLEALGICATVDPYKGLVPKLTFRVNRDSEVECSDMRFVNRDCARGIEEYKIRTEDGGNRAGDVILAFLVDDEEVGPYFIHFVNNTDLQDTILFVFGSVAFFLLLIMMLLRTVDY